MDTERLAPVAGDYVPSPRSSLGSLAALDSMEFDAAFRSDSFDAMLQRELDAGAAIADIQRALAPSPEPEPGEPTSSESELEPPSPQQAPLSPPQAAPQQPDSPPLPPAALPMDLDLNLGVLDERRLSDAAADRRLSSDFGPRDRRFSSDASDASVSTSGSAGRRSKFRGVTRTSRSGWGAKYSSRRIVSTCRSEEEAALIYDAFLVDNHPDKWLSYANFCSRCGLFRNPLKLPEPESAAECACAAPPEMPPSGDALRARAAEVAAAGLPGAAAAREAAAAAGAGDVAAPVTLSLQTPFLPRYWRNDRKNVQCFPTCPQHGSYELCFLQNLKHSVRGVCRSPVELAVTGPIARLALLCWFEPLDQPRLPHLVHEGAEIGPADWDGLCAGATTATLQSCSADAAAQAVFSFKPDVWKFEANLPKKKRGSADSELPQMRLRVAAYVAMDDAARVCRAVADSPPFTMGSTRTLVRHKDQFAREAGLLPGAGAGAGAAAADVDDAGTVHERAKRARTERLEPPPAGATLGGGGGEEDVDMVRAWAAVPLEASLAAVDHSFSAVMGEQGAAEATPGFALAGSGKRPARNEDEEDEDDDDDEEEDADEAGVLPSAGDLDRFRAGTVTASERSFSSSDSEYSTRFSTQGSQLMGRRPTFHSAGIIDPVDAPAARLGAHEVVGQVLVAPVYALACSLALTVCALLSVLTLPAFGVGVGVFVLTVQLACFMARGQLQLANAACRHVDPASILSAREAPPGTLAHKFSCTQAYDIDGDSLRCWLYMWLGGAPVAVLSSALALAALAVALPLAAVPTARNAFVCLAEEMAVTHARVGKWFVGRESVVYGLSDPYDAEERGGNVAGVGVGVAGGDKVPYGALRG